MPVLTRLFSVLAVVLASVATSVVVPASASSALEWSLVPASEEGGGAPDDRVSLRHVIEPGESARDAVALTNHSGQEVTFAVTSGDGMVGSGGAFDIAPGEPEGSGSWVTVDGVTDGEVSLEAGETTVLPVLIEVPEEATPGDHPAGIVAGLSNEADGVTITQRIGVRLHLQVAGEVLAGLDFSDVSADFTPSWVPFAPGTLTVDYTVANTGNARLGGSVVAGVSGPWGLAPAQGTADLPELLPGDSAPGSVQMEVSPMFTLGGEVRTAAAGIGQDQIALPEAATQQLRSAAVSWTGTGLVLILVLVVLGRLRARRRALARRSAHVGDPGNTQKGPALI